MQEDACHGQAVLVPVGFWPRGMAFLIDLMLFASLHCIFFLVLGKALMRLEPGSLFAVFGAVVFFLICFLFTPFLMFLLYGIVLHACGGQTIGKLVMGIKLVLVDGNAVTAGVSFLRGAASVLSFLSFGAGFVWVVFSRDRFAWHDVVAGTMVISAEQTS